MSEKKPNRRWLQFSLRSLLLLMTAIIVVLVVWRTWFRPNEPIEVRVSIYDGSTIQPDGSVGPPTVYVITDKKLMRQLVLKPLRNAEKDPHPADWKIHGVVELEYADGAKEVLILMNGCHSYKHGDDYFNVDFSELRDFLRSQGINWHF